MLKAPRRNICQTMKSTEVLFGPTLVKKGSSLVGLNSSWRKEVTVKFYLLTAIIRRFSRYGHIVGMAFDHAG